MKINNKRIKKMETIFTEIESRDSVCCDRLIYISVYVLVTSGDDYYGRWDGTAASAVECGRANGFCTPDKEKAFQKWDEYTKNHYSRRG